MNSNLSLMSNEMLWNVLFSKCLGDKYNHEEIAMYFVYVFFKKGCN